MNELTYIQFRSVVQMSLYSPLEWVVLKAGPGLKFTFCTIRIQKCT